MVLQTVLKYLQYRDKINLVYIFSIDTFLNID